MKITADTDTKKITRYSERRDSAEGQGGPQ